MGKNLDNSNCSTQTAAKQLETIRHSCAHVLANAILKLWPEAQFAAGPPIATGFYYDVDLPHRITPEDFERLEKEMRKVIEAAQPFERQVISREEALAMGQRGELAGLSARSVPSRFKVDIIEHAFRVVRQMTARLIKCFASNMWRSHALIASLEFCFFGELLELFDEHGSFRQPERKAGANIFIKREELKFFS